MGGVALLHPEDCLFFPTEMRSRRFSSNFTDPPSQSSIFTVPDSRRRTPPKGVQKKKNDRNTETMTTKSSAAMVSKNLVMGQVKILKRGERFNESSTILKEVNNRKVSNDAASTSEAADRQASKVPIGSRRVLPKKKKAEKDKTSSVSSPKVETTSKAEDHVLSSTHRLGPDPEIVSKQMKNITLTECFAGSAFSDSPPPSSVPLPGFFRNNFVANGKDDATTDLRRILGLSFC